MPQTPESSGPEAATTAEIRVSSATSWRRATAGLIDAAAIGLLWAPLAWAITPSSDELPVSPWNAFDRLVDLFNQQPALFVWPLVLLALISLGWNLMWQLIRGYTPGKRVMKLETIDVHGEAPSPGRVVAHCLWRLPSVGLLYAGNLWALADPERRTLHDRLARVYVTQPAQRNKEKGAPVAPAANRSAPEAPPRKGGGDDSSEPLRSESRVYDA